MVLRTAIKRNFAVLLMLLIIASIVSADQSELVISVNEQTNELFVEKLFDDDGSIERVDVCLLTLSETVSNETLLTKAQCRGFENVIEGQVLNIVADGILDTGTINFTQQISVGEPGGSASFALPSAICGDASCDSGETCSNCSQDCGECPPPPLVCGNGTCEENEDCWTCQTDCGACFCGNNTCDPQENCLTCAEDCSTCQTTTRTAAYYNFIDTDGLVTNSQFLVFATPAVFAPAAETKTIAVGGANMVESKSLTPKILDDKKGFEVEARTKLRLDSEPWDVRYYWRTNDNQSFQSKSMEKDDQGDFVYTVGPFNDPITLESFLEIKSDSKTVLHAENFNTRMLHWISPDEKNFCKKVTFTNSAKLSKKTADNGQANNIVLGGVSSQPRWGQSVSRIRVVPNKTVSEGFRVKNVRDETIDSLNKDEVAADDIDFLNIFVVTPNGVSSASYSDVKENTVLRLPVLSSRIATDDPDIDNLIDKKVFIDDPAGWEIFYNFMDSDNAVGNMRLLVPLNQSDIIDTPSQLPLDRDTFINQVEIGVIPSEDCTTFKLKFRAAVPTEKNVEKVFLKYGFGDYDLSRESAGHSGVSNSGPFKKQRKNSGELVLELQGEEGVFEGEIGPFSSAFEFFSRVYAQTSGGESANWQNFFGWFGISPPEEQLGLKTKEICGNNIDDNLDGSIDEGCVLLPELLFVGNVEIPGFVEVGNQINILGKIKNAGVSNTTSFSVSFLVNGKLVDSISFDNGLNVGQESDIKFSVLDSTPFLGVNQVKVVIDSVGSVPELNKANNEVSKELTVGFNSFNVILNFNGTALMGDTRKFRAFNRQDGLPEAQTITTITFPSGKTQELITGKDGTSDFQLSESGVYFLTASKEKFEPFEAAFTILKIDLVNLAQRYDIGSEAQFSVETSNGEKVRDAVVEIRDPNNQVTVVKLDADAAGKFLIKIGGTHEVTVSRKGVQILKKSFLASGLIESIFIAGSFEELLFGSIVRNTPLFAILFLFAAGAAIVAFSRSKLLFKAETKSTKQEQLENVARMFIAIVFFLLPFQVSNHLGFNGGLATVVLEVFLAFLFEYYEKKMKKRKLAIRVK